MGLDCGENIFRLIGVDMKVEKLMRKMYQAIIDGDVVKEKILWLKAIRKSLKGKDTQGIR